MPRRTSRSKKAKPVELFISYSHDNAVWFDRLRPVTKFNESNDHAYAWNDQQMKVGDRWDKEIKDALERMDVFVCLVSFEFLASSYVRSVELPRALEREENDEIEIVPIVVYDMDLGTESPELNEFNPLPAWGKCWRAYEQNGGHYQDAHGDIRNGLRQAIDKVLAKR